MTEQTAPQTEDVEPTEPDETAEQIISAAPDGVTVDIERINRTIARAWLKEYNTHNRHMRPMRVARYARDQRAGNWIFTGMPVTFDWNNVLVNGQHTLEAIDKSGIEADLVIVRGLDPRAQRNTDVGGARTYADTLALDKEKNAALLAALARRVVRFRSGIVAAGGVYMTSPEEMAAFLDGNQLARRAAEIGARAITTRTPIPPSIVATLFFLASEIDPVTADLFWITQVIEELGLAEGDPARALLRRMRGERMHSDFAFRYGVLAWNHHRKGSRIAKLQAPTSGWNDKTLHLK